MSDDLQAFPMRGTQHDEDLDDRHNGMSLRDYFAAKALQGMLAHDWTVLSPYQFAENAYRMADAMMVARKEVSPAD